MPAKVNFNTLWNLIPFPGILVNKENIILSVNHASELYFLSSAKRLEQKSISNLFRGLKELHDLIDIVREKNRTRVHYDLNFSSPTVDENYRNVHIIPFDEETGEVLILLETKSNLDNLTSSMTYRTAAKSVTKMSAMLAHEIRNPLAGIYGAAELLEKSVKRADQELTSLVKAESKRIGKLVDTFEKFGELGPFSSGHFNVHDVLDRSIASMVTVFGENVAIVKKYDPSLPDVYGDSDKIFQVFQNLIKNAFEAIGNHPGKIVVETKFKIGFKNLPLVITISDNGIGIPKSIKNQIFQPFISEKLQGTGLGLSLVSKIVNEHNGIIDFTSSEEGTNFRLLMPIKKIVKGNESDLEYFRVGLTQTNKC